MRKVLLISLLFICFHGFGYAVDETTDDIAKHPDCFYCGMDRTEFAHSRVQIKYDDGSILGVCSLHCAALDMALFADKMPVFFGVGDYKTKKLIDAEKAHWVIGGDKAGVMTPRAKWAFENKAEADEFIKAHGGTAAGFEDALEATYADMYKGLKMSREKHKKMSGGK